MGLVSNLSITKKLVLITMGSSALALLVVTFVNFAMQAYLYRESLAEHMTTVARAIGSTNVAALTFEDELLGQQALSAFENEPTFLNAHLYDRHGRLLAHYEHVHGDDEVANVYAEDVDPVLLGRSVETEATIRAERDAAAAAMLDNPTDQDAMLRHARLSIRLREFEPAVSTLER